MSSSISVSEWQAALQAADIPVAGFTTRDVMAALGRPEGWVRKRLQQLAATGQLVCVGKRMVPRVDGQLSPVPVFRLRKGKK
jgi:hypothetical protein